MIHLPAQFPVSFTASKGPWVEITSPNDQTPLSKVQYATMEDAEVLLKTLPQAQTRMESLKAFERSLLLRKVAEMVRRDAQELALLIASEGGKPLRDARVEVARAAVTLELAAEEALRLGGEALPMERTPAALNHVSFTMRVPIGPVLAISAFNHPLNLLAHQVGCAVGSGCAVVVKPAPQTPFSGLKLHRYFIEAGLPEECLAVVNCEVPVIQRLASASEISYLSFIGSAMVGWGLRKVIAPGTRLALEHGGTAPAIVREDADLVEAAKALVKGAFYHSGQVCISTQRIFVHPSKLKEFSQLFLAEIKKLKVGDATLEDTDLGPLVRPAEVKRLQEWIAEARSQGAELLTGNEVSGNAGQHLSPTVLLNVPRDAKLMTEEAFGPVVCLNSYQDENELLTYLKQSPYVFEACVFTRDISAALRFAKEVPAMTFVINDHNAYRVDWMPFGGQRLSGLGMGGVKYSMEEMTSLKQIIIKY